MSLTFLELARKAIEQAKRPLDVHEIWDISEEHGWLKALASEGKTPKASLYSLLYLDIQRRGEESLFLAVGSNPRKWYLRSLGSIEQAKETLKEAEEVKPVTRDPNLPLEKELHPLLAYYVRTKMRAYMKTINHTKSSKIGFSEWLHPDAVACYFPHTDLNSSLLQLVERMGEVTIKIFSFELKRELNYGNLREAFFQAVSNSSWAHQGYLVAAGVLEDPEFQRDLERLSSSFGIGVIRLDLQDKDSSEELLPARQREQLDINTMQALAERNDEFRSFLDAVRGDHETKRIIDSQYDQLETDRTEQGRDSDSKSVKSASTSTKKTSHSRNK